MKTFYGFSWSFFWNNGAKLQSAPISGANSLDFLATCVYLSRYYSCYLPESPMEISLLGKGPQTSKMP